jgi:hypothetical protein
VRSAELTKFSVGKRRAECVRGGRAMDGIKRAGMTPLGREQSKAAKRGLANKRFSFIAVFVITSFIATRVHTPDGETSRATRRKVRGASPNSKTFNVKVPSHDNSLKFNDFSCNRSYRAEGAVRHTASGIRHTVGGRRAARAVAGNGWLVAGLEAEATWHRHPADGVSKFIGRMPMPLSDALCYDIYAQARLK